ncbi:hypothetical protein [Mycolicibacterium mageritense]|uniref:hypothetical protein n=1 Tax=Mycolicibacterium mageritense TaxID=53462 RepID=UPI0023F51BE6|nr:hypothetical protein [Mycolicibacterium mageritense]
MIRRNRTHGRERRRSDHQDRGHDVGVGQEHPDRHAENQDHRGLRLVREPSPPGLGAAVHPGDRAEHRVDDQIRPARQQQRHARDRQSERDAQRRAMVSHRRGHGDAHLRVHADGAHAFSPIDQNDWLATKMRLPDRGATVKAEVPSR